MIFIHKVEHQQHFFSLYIVIKHVFIIVLQGWEL